MAKKLLQKSFTIATLDKINIERPKRLKSQLRDDLIETLKFDKTLEEPMQWCLRTYKESCYIGLSIHKKAIEEHLEKNDIELNTKQLISLLSKELWAKHYLLFSTAKRLQDKIGTTLYDDFNIFKVDVEKTLKNEKIKLSATELNTILNAVSWYDENAQKVIKKISKISGEKKEQLLEHLTCKENELAHFGYFATGKKDEFVEYESETELRDSENIPLHVNIQAYFLQEVKPHVEEAWINLDSVKIGYEISFNKYFYTHKPLRTLEEVAKDILELEEASEGLIKEILGV